MSTDANSHLSSEELEDLRTQLDISFTDSEHIIVTNYPVSRKDEVCEFVSRLRKHADFVAGGGPSASNYDPETLVIEHTAADMIESLLSLVDSQQGDEAG